VEDAAFREKLGITTSMLSLSAPGAQIVKDPEGAAQLARRVNERFAKKRDEDPSSFGFFAALPSLMDKDLTLKEIEYAFDVLHADGVTLFTRYGSGHHYLGHPDFIKIWDELDRRDAVVYIHPTYPADHTPFRPNMPQSVFDFVFETTKTAVDLILSHSMSKHPRCKVILSHAGGTLPYIVTRPSVGMPAFTNGFTEVEFIATAQDFYYDTACSGGEYVLMVIEKFAKPGHILFGSDFPYAHKPSIIQHCEGLDAFPFKDPGLLERINFRNALALFPRLVRFQNES
jgi:predicted TIM-barrel fold metal-dependent hydrolase